MFTKLRLVFSISILFVSFYSFGQVNYWKTSSLQGSETSKTIEHLDKKQLKSFELDKATFINALPKNNSKIVYFPNDKGALEAFTVEEKSVFAPELAKKYPNIKSYVGKGVNSNDRIRFSVSPKGIQSMVVRPGTAKTTFMQLATNDNDLYVVYNRNAEKVKGEFLCDTKDIAAKSNASKSLKLVDDKIVRTFRIAVAASGEYTAYHGGTVADALAAINATLTRVNEVFEVDLGVSLELVATSDQVIYTDASSDPFGGNLTTEAQSVFTTEIGNDNYDLGHLFHAGTNSGNAGTVGSVCNTNWKGSAYSSRTVPEGDLFDVDFVSHEIGHQFGANHTWSFESEGTQVQAEPASGTTIMGYAGITDGNNVAPNGEDYFHYYSIFQIQDYLDGITCGTISSVTNNPPVISALSNYVIPKGTAFVLEGNATDPDTGDVLSYTWEQIDDGVVTRASFGPNNPSGANFRSQKPSNDTKRYFPAISQVLQGQLTQENPAESSAWETVSNVERDMNFAFTVRDNVIGGGQVVAETMKINVVNAAGPFVVNSQATNLTYSAGSIQEITWDVANTNVAPVSAELVDIYLSLNGGNTFDTLLAEDVPNDGSETIQIPNVASTMARIMVMPSNNVFFAVNTSNFTIASADIVLNFDTLEYEVCQPSNLTIPFVYETNNGLNETATLSITGEPIGLGVALSNGSASSNNTNVNLEITNTNAVATGVYPITIIATAPSYTTQVEIMVGIYNSTFTNVVLTSPTDNAIDVNLDGPLVWEENVAYSGYDIEIATDVNFNTIVESASTVFSSYMPTNVVSETTYFWRVRPKNSCGTGSFGTPFTFDTVSISCKNGEGNSLPIEISSVGRPTITSNLTFLDDLPISDVNVNLELTHDYLSDLIISLTSPSGTTVVLTSNSCGDFQDINTTFDDDANPFVCGSGNGAAINGTVKPLGALSAFNGETLQGEWTLTIEDTAASDGGELTGFSLDVCVEGSLRPDADNDGVFDDGDDLCLGTPQGSEVDVNGCAVYRYESSNFTIAAQSESCIEANDGQIMITTETSMNYTVVVSGNSNSTNTFTDSYTLNGLSAGTYSVCISGTDGTITYEEYCATVEIKEPDPLIVSSNLTANGKQIVLELAGGELYNIELNGRTIQTTASVYVVDLKSGSNALKVTTGLACQGIYEDKVFYSEEPVLYPNPTSALTTLFLGVASGEVKISIFTPSGRFINNKKYAIANGETEIDVSYLSNGMYIMLIEGEGIKASIKLIKR